MALWTFQESSSQQSECSVSSKKDKVESKDLIVKASELKHTKSDENRSDRGAIPSTSKEVHNEQQLSQVVRAYSCKSSMHGFFLPHKSIDFIHFLK